MSRRDPPAAILVGTGRDFDEHVETGRPGGPLARSLEGHGSCCYRSEMIRMASPRRLLRSQLRTTERGLRFAIVASALVAGALAVASWAHDGHDHDLLRSELMTVDGLVDAVEEGPGEGGLAVVVLRLEKAEDESALRLLLAPAAALADAGFEVRPGDGVRARVFPGEEPTLFVHKIWNVSTHREVRLRTLSRQPVWDSEGEWQGETSELCPYRPDTSPEGSEPDADAPAAAEDRGTDRDGAETPRPDR